MKPLDLSEVTKYVEDNIGTFHLKRKQSIENLKLSQILKKKNPYLFRAKNILASELVKAIFDAHVSSNEETIFGDWLEGLAIFVNQKVFTGRKTGITGIDIEFDKNGNRYIVAVKSGPNWGNSGQINKMKSDFITAKKALRTSNSNLNVIAVNGCCYGKDNKPDKGEYFKYCGQQFWEFISGDSTLYTEIIQPLGHQAEDRKIDFQEVYTTLLNKFNREFSIEYCKEDGTIDWEKIVVLNSAKSVFSKKK